MNKGYYKPLLKVLTANSFQGVHKVKYFYHNVKKIFAFFTLLTFAVMVEKQLWIKPLKENI